jgi:hypothetical protein
MKLSPEKYGVPVHGTIRWCSPWDRGCYSARFTEQFPSFRVTLWVGQLHEGNAMPAKRNNLQNENFMGGLYLGVAVTSVEALVAMGLVIAFM